uniref:Putative salivary secreted peptide n=1 Tax=Ixodes ricinus TaxID=34613 RepID=V5IC10_IXORI
MEIMWRLVYFLLSISLVFGDSPKLDNLTEKPLKAPKEPATATATPAQKGRKASTSTQAIQNKTSPKTTAAPKPSTDPIICGLKNNRSNAALPSLQCTLQHLPQNLTEDWKKYMDSKGKNESELLKEICKAGETNKDPDFMANYTENDKAMIYDTSTLCRIRHTTKSECEIQNLIK